MTVVAFLIFPARTENFNVESLHGHAVTKSLRDTILEIQTKIGRRIYEICLRLGYYCHILAIVDYICRLKF